MIRTPGRYLKGKLTVLMIHCRGLYMGVQQTFGGVSKVAFPVATGIAMDRLGLGVPFIVAGVIVAATLILTSSIDQHGLPPAHAAKRAS